jgi:multidrug resistance protein, MATE family
MGGRVRNMAKDQEKQLSSLKYLLLFSLPSILSSLLEPLSGLVDTALVGQLSTRWLAALAISVTIFNSFTWMFNFLVHASTQTISKSYANKNYSELASKIKISLGIAFGLGLFSCGFLYLIRTPLFLFTGAEKELIPLIESYFFIRLIGHPFTLLYTTLVSILRGLQKITFCFWIILFTTFLNIIISWLLLFKLNYGIEGAAIGTVLSNLLGVIISFTYLLRDSSIREKYFNKTKVELEHLFNFGKNSANIFGRSFFLTGSFFLSTKMSAFVGINSLAAHQILLQVWLFSSFFLDGIAISGNILGAKYVEEKNYKLLDLTFRKLLQLGFLIGLIFTLIYLAFSHQIIHIFTVDQKVSAILLSIWPLIIITQIPNAYSFVYDGLMFGLEAFAFLRKHMIIGVLFIFLPFALSIHFSKQLILLWFGLSLLNIYRGITGMIGVKTALRPLLEQNNG